MDMKKKEENTFDEKQDRQECEAAQDSEVNKEQKKNISRYETQADVNFILYLAGICFGYFHPNWSCWASCIKIKKIFHITSYQR